MDCHLSNVQVYYPGQIALKLNKSIRFRFKDKLIEVKILRHFKPIEIRDFRKSFEVDEAQEIKFSGTYSVDENSQSNYTNGFCYSVKNDNYRLNFINDCYYTELNIKYSCSLHDYTKSQKLILSILDHFILSYRLSTGDYTIRLAENNSKKQILINEYYSKFTELQKEYPDDKKLEILQQYGHLYKPFNNFTAGDVINNFNHDEIDFDKAFDQLVSYFKNNEYSLNSELLNKAYENYHLDNNNNLALLNSFISIEISVSNFIDEVYKSNHISNNKIKAYKTEVSMAYKLTILLPVIFKELKDDKKKLLTQANTIRDRRNKLVHEGIQVEEREAKLAIDTAAELMEFLNLELRKLKESSSA